MIWSSHAKRDSADTGYYGVRSIASLHCCPRCPEEAALDHFLDASNFSENKTKPLLLRVHAAQLLDGLVRRDVAWPVGPQRSQGLNAVPLIIDNYVVFIARWLVGQTAQLELHKGSRQEWVGTTVLRENFFWLIKPRLLAGVQDVSLVHWSFHIP